MLKAGEITGDLKNLNKQTFTKLEEFIKAKIEARLKLDQIQEALEGKDIKFLFLFCRTYQIG